MAPPADSAPPEIAVILAAGLGTRLRRSDSKTPRLKPRQEAVAASGIKALMPVPRPFLDYSLAALAEAGLRRVCVVTAPRQQSLRQHCRMLSGGRLQIETVVQHRPRGTADALLAARCAVHGENFLMINSDNYYPPEMLRGLIELDGPGLILLDRAQVLAASGGNLTEAKLSSYAVARIDRHGWLVEMIEKPSRELWEQLPEPVLVNINAWRFSDRIFEGCRSIAPSLRGELELQAAALTSRDSGVRYRAVITGSPILDLSSRADVPAVETALAGVSVRL